MPFGSINAPGALSVQFFIHRPRGYSFESSEFVKKLHLYNIISVVVFAPVYRAECSSRTNNLWSRRYFVCNIELT